MTNGPIVTARPSEGIRDLNRMYDLAIATRDDALHVADLPWRLTSPSAQMPNRTRLWEDADGALVAWAVLQFPWLCLDYVIHPDAQMSDLESALFAWAGDRLEIEAAGRDEPLRFFANARAHDADRIAAIERAGFSREPWSYVHLSRELDAPIAASESPAGFVIRQLVGEDEVEACVAVQRAAFNSTSMTADWRRATLQNPAYVPDLDLVAIASDGTLVGFSVCWITPELPGGRVAQVEPLCIRPSYQRRGLGRALLLEGLRRARALGATRMEVNAESYNPASQGAYQAVGFRLAYEAPFFRRDFGERGN